MTIFDDVLDQKQIDKYMLISDEVCDELGRAHRKFPDQSLPWGGPLDLDVGVDIPNYGLIRDIMRSLVDALLKDGTVTWADVVAEKFWEAYAETDWKRARAELIQLAAMCFRTIADMDGKEAGNGSAT